MTNKLPSIIPKKALGQHWLNDEPSLLSIVQAAELTSEVVVLEIGPGLGSLTKVIAGQARRVIAVEFDARLAEQLPRRLPDYKNIEVVSADILTFDFTSLPVDYKIVANIPYYLTSNLIKVISETPNPPKLAVLLIAQEVAERVNASPGQMSILSVSAQLYWEVSLGVVIKAALFTPPPKIDSQVLILKARGDQLFPGIDEHKFFALVKAGFGQKRKTLLNALSSGLRLGRETAAALCGRAGIDPTARAQTLSLEDWYRLYLAYTNNT